MILLISEGNGMIILRNLSVMDRLFVFESSSIYSLE